MAASDPWSTRHGRKVRARCWRRDLATHAPCCICHGERGPIDYSVAPSSTPLSWEPEHIRPRSRWPELVYDMANIGASHRVCNREKGAKAGMTQLGNRSRQW